jgi:hypothetical protein
MFYEIDPNACSTVAFKHYTGVQMPKSDKRTSLLPSGMTHHCKEFNCTKVQNKERKFILSLEFQKVISLYEQKSLKAISD